MKSWIHIAFYALLVYLGLSFTSCVEGNEAIPGTDGLPAEEAYLSFQIHTHSTDILSRATTDYGTAEERKVSQIYMLLYESGGATGKLLKKIQIRATNASGIFEGEDVVNRKEIPRSENNFVMKAIPVEKKNYQLVILINPTATILNRAIESISTLGDFQTAVIQTSPTDYQTSDGHFMTNAGGVVQVLESDLKGGETLAEDNPVAVFVERILAKVFVLENRSKKLTEVTTGGTIESVQWALDVTNKQTYLIRQQDKFKNGTPEFGFAKDRSLVYSRDPNFTGNKTIISNEQERNKHFTMLDPLNSTDFQPWNAYGETTEYNQYSLENTISADDQNASDTDILEYLTHVVLKVIISNPGKVIADNDYYSFSYLDSQDKRQWTAFTHAQAVEWFNGTYPADMPSALHTALVEAQAQNGSPFRFKIENMVSPPPPDAYASVKTTVGQVTFHKAGLNIYRIPIRHFGTDAGTNDSDYGYYGIVRNNTYKLIINSINGPGTGTSGEGFLSTQIIVNPWLDRGWSEGLEPNEP